MAILPPVTNVSQGVKNYALLAGDIEANGGKLPANNGFATMFADLVVQQLGQEETADRSYAKADANSNPQLSNDDNLMADDVHQMKDNIVSSKNNQVLGNSALEDPYNNYEAVVSS
jgi:hypothetical protein